MTATNGAQFQASRFGDRPQRNEALDYLRASALFLMSLVHMWRDLLGYGGVDAVILFIGECAPFLFFVAFGMTQNRMVKKSAADVLRFVLLFGLIGVFHGYFLLYTSAWDFFLFLWFSSLLVLSGAWLGLGQRHFLALSAAILVINFLRPLGVWTLFAQQAPADTAFARHLWWLPGPFYPLPWAVLVFFGFALGMGYRPRTTQLFAAVVAITVVLALAVVVRFRPQLPFAARLVLEKSDATSPYLVLGCSGAVLAYAAVDRLSYVKWTERWLYPTVRFVSDNLMVGTILHYLLLRCLAAEFLPWCRAVGGMRVVSWGVVAALSAGIVILLVTALKLLLWLWESAQQHLDRFLRRTGVTSVTMGGVALWAVLHFSLGFIRLGYLKWSAYAAMMSLALFYGYDRDRHRAGQERKALR